MNSTASDVEEAILAIDRFVNATAGIPAAMTPGCFPELSRHMQLAKSARERHSSRVSDRAFAELCDRYRVSLERLRIRLAYLEANLTSERNHLIGEYEQVTRTREWHVLLSTTQ